MLSGTQVLRRGLGRSIQRPPSTVSSSSRGDECAASEGAAHREGKTEKGAEADRPRWGTAPCGAAVAAGASAAPRSRGSGPRAARVTFLPRRARRPLRHTPPTRGGGQTVAGSSRSRGAVMVRASNFSVRGGCVVVADTLPAGV